MPLKNFFFFKLLSFPIVFSAIKTVSWLWRKSDFIVSGEGGGAQISPGQKHDYSKMHSRTAAQLQPKVIFFGLLCFSFRPYSCKMCILDLAKIQLNCIGEGQICPGQKIYELPNNIYFCCPFFFNYFFCVNGKA